MNRISFAFGGLRSLEPIMEVGLGVAAAGFTIVIWLAGSAPAPSASMSQAAARHITLPAVLVVGSSRS